MTTPNIFVVLEELAARCDQIAQARGHVKDDRASGWLDKAAALRACSDELRRLQDIEQKARAVDSLYDEKHQVVLMCTRVRDGLVEHHGHFEALRKALRANTVTEKQTGEPG